MNKQIIEYLEKNKDEYSQESLITQLKNSGHSDVDIQENVRIVYGDDRQNNQNIKVASQGKRFINLLIDTACYYIFSFGIGVILGATGLYTILNVDEWNNIIFSISIVSSFFIFFETIWAKTPGKLVTKTRVIMKDDKSKPLFGTIVLRTLCRFIPFEAFSFLGSKNPQGWHDTLSKTVVIDDK
jgi:uncharacterized RDD family membrane protein YckC